MTREEVRLEVMRRWPAHTYQDVLNLTPQQIHDLLTTEPATLSFATTEDYERWRATTKL